MSSQKLFMIKNILLKFCIIGLCFASCSSSGKKEDPTPEPPTQTDIPFKVMTYNIWAVRTGGLTEHVLQDIAAVIKRADPDLVALQEVDSLTRRNPIDITKKLAELTGMHYFFAKAMDYQGGGYGEAILSKLPIKDAKRIPLGTTTELPGEPRAMAQVTVEKNNKEIYFIGTHLDHLANEANRIKQATDIVAYLKTLDKPIIFGGDLNALPNSQTMNILKNHLISGCINNICAFTFPADNPNRAIDYLMYAPLNSFSVSSYQAYTWASTTSDHLPVLATFRLKSM